VTKRKVLELNILHFQAESSGCHKLTIILLSETPLYLSATSMRFQELEDFKHNLRICFVT